MSEKLTVEHLKENLRYDPESGNFHLLKRVSSSDKRAFNQIVGCKNKSGYIQIGLNHQRLYGHRLAWLYMNGEWPSAMIDHINGDKADNRWCNLRCVSNQVNTMNVKKCRRKNTSGYLGVTKTSLSKKNPFMAQIVRDGKHEYIGIFPTAELAHEAYMKRKMELHPEAFDV